MVNKYRNEVWLSQQAFLTTRNVKLKCLDECVGGLVAAESEVHLNAKAIENPERYEPRYPVELQSSILGTAYPPNHQQSSKTATL